VVNFGPRAAEIDWQVWGTPAYFNGYRILASLVQRRRSTEVNQTLHDVWPSAGLVYCIYIFGGSCPLMIFCQVQNSLCVQVWHSPILATLLHGTGTVGIAKLCGMVQGMELWNLHSSSFSTEGTTYMPRASITLGIGPHSSYNNRCCGFFETVDVVVAIISF